MTNAIVKLSEHEDIYTKQITVICLDLVGTSMNWIAPAIILGQDVLTFANSLVKKYNAKLTLYYDSTGIVKWFGYYWNNLQDARRFKNYVNKIAREKKITLKDIIN